MTKMMATRMMRSVADSVRATRIQHLRSDSESSKGLPGPVEAAAAPDRLRQSAADSDVRAGAPVAASGCLWASCLVRVTVQHHS